MEHKKTCGSHATYISSDFIFIAPNKCKLQFCQYAFQCQICDMLINHYINKIRQNRFIESKSNADNTSFEIVPFTAMSISDPRL